jgi:Secretion system C-terminal sorting domain
MTYDFNYTPVKIINTPYEPPKYPIWNTNASICDKDGNLVLYTNGCAIIKPNHQAVIGADTINRGEAVIALCKQGGYNTKRSLFLPDYQEKEGYTLFHIWDQRFPQFKTQLRYSHIIPDAQTQWKAKEVDVPIMPEIEIDIKQAACRHANGRDWWVVNPLRYEPKVITVLYSQGKIKQELLQAIDTLPVKFTDGGATFTPDGRKYIYYELATGIRIYNFDRSLGKISNPIHIKDNASFDSTLIADIFVSPNSRFLYLTRGFDILQYDLEANNIAASRIEIVSWRDTSDIVFDNGTPVAYYTGVIGKDGKAYIASYGGLKYMHIIESPNEKGKLCKIHLTSILGSNAFTMPYFPNFRLGALKGSLCDTLTTALKEPKVDIGIKVYPNPSDGILKLSFYDTNTSNETPHTIQIFNTMGGVMKYIEIERLQDTDIDTQGIPSGVYILKVTAKDGLWSKTIKVSILH